MKTAQWINGSNDNAAERVRRMFVMHKAMPGDKRVKQLLQQAVRQAKTAHTFAEAEAGWLELDNDY